jgi:hypothetical protein
MLLPHFILPPWKMKFGPLWNSSQVLVLDRHEIFHENIRVKWANPFVLHFSGVSSPDLWKGEHVLSLLAPFLVARRNISKRCEATTRFRHEINEVCAIEKTHTRQEIPYCI